MRACVCGPRNKTGIAVTLESAKVGRTPEAIRISMPWMGHRRGNRDVLRRGCDHLDRDVFFIIGLLDLLKIRSHSAHHLR
jgi:hypothetical protein